KNIIDERLTLASALSLQTDVVGLDAMAISNAVTEFQGKNEDQLDNKGKEVFAILDVGELKITIVIFRNNVPHFTREISIGGRDCTQKIMDALNCSAQEAEEIKCHPGSRQAEVFAACQGIMQNLVSEIRLSLDYFSSEDSSGVKVLADQLGAEESSQVSKIFLTGDNANCLMAREFFAKELEVPAELWVPLAELEFADEALREKFFENINQLSVALGLAVTKND
ncbi:MAG: pilus assembly protein PilM, partial [Candidatus Omnitrophica bacterium]|nr:pilus assembly protein PilM [Candidatus Omnitrophota bacterium]